MTVSVVCGTWNRYEMVCQMIQAALNQSRKPDEIIIVDDCSTDGTFDKLCKQYENHSIVKIYKQEKNTGGVPNWNSAIDFSTGDLIAWCSDDDRFFQWHIENARNFLDLNDDIDLIHSGFASINEDDEKQISGSINEEILERVQKHPFRSFKELIIQGQEILPYFTQNYNWPFHASTLVFRRKVWNNIGKFNSEYELADSEWFIRVALKHKVAYLPYYGVLNRRHSGNWSSSMGSVKMQVEVNKMMQRHILEMKKDNNIKLFLNSFLWKLNYEQILFRIFISRTRAGMKDTASNAVGELRKSSFLMKIILNRYITQLLMFFLGFFRKKSKNPFEPQ